MVLSIVVLSAVYGQNDSVIVCSTDYINALLQSKDSRLTEELENFELNYQETASKGHSKSNKNTKVLPIVIHIVHQNGPENISDAQALLGLNHLNDAFANVGYYDASTGVDTKIQFCLAQRDTTQQAISGIIRHESVLTDVHEFDYDEFGKLAHYNSNEYINIRLVREACSNDFCAGFSVNGHLTSSKRNGIVVQAKYFGSSASNSAIAVHEMGHYLGLSHTFKGGCRNDNCLKDGDKVCDTPPDNSTGEFACQAIINSCTTDSDDKSNNNPYRPISNGGVGEQNDLSDNYMDYNDKSCRKAFTSGQTARMHSFIENVIPSILNSKACLPPCNNVPIALFSVYEDIIPVGTQMTFLNLSNGNNFSWYLENRLISQDQDLVWPFEDAGEYSIILEVSNNNPLCDTVTYERCIKVYCNVESKFTHDLTGQVISLSDTSVNNTKRIWYIKDEVGDTIEVATNRDFEYNMASRTYVEVCLNAANDYCEDVECVQINLLGNEVCGNGMDDDGDGLVDYYDSDCPCNDNLFQAQCPNECLRLPSAVQDIQMKLKWQSEIIGRRQWNNCTVGDIDHDGITEVLVKKRIIVNGINLESSLLLINGRNGQTKNDLVIGGFKSQFAIGGFNGSNSNVFISSVDSLTCLNENGEKVWATEKQNKINSGPTSLADINEDGLPELIYTDEIYNAVNGKLLAKGGDVLGCNLPGQANASWTPSDDQCFHSSSIVAELLDSPGLEIAAGNVVYDPVISNTNGFVGNNVNVIKAAPEVKNGYTSVGDINGDGKLDVIVVRSSEYSDGGGIWVWDPRTSNLIAQASSNTSGGIAFIGDVDGDCLPEIGMTFKLELRLYKYNGGKNLELLYRVPTSDDSGYTGMTMFDFNQDGAMELIYRDEENLRILKGLTGETIASTTLKSGTASEYPVVADVDNDGDAEILVTGYLTNEDEYRVYCFESDGLEWAPARAVWNQDTYNVININDDLTIPRVPQNNAIALDYPSFCPRDNCGTPYNNFRAQATYRTQSGCLVWPGNNFDLSIDAEYSCSTGHPQLCFYTTTTDTSALMDGIPLVCYPGNALTDETAIDRFLIDSDTFCISLDLSAHDSIQVVLNDRDISFPPSFTPSPQMECDYSNNTKLLHIESPQLSLNLGPDIVKCHTEVFTLNAGFGFESYEWNDLTIDSIYSSDEVGWHYVTALDECGTIYTDSVFVSLSTSPILDIGRDTTICKDDILTYSLPSLYSSIQWIPEDMVDCADCHTVQIKASEDICLKVIAEYDDNCYVSDSMTINVRPTIEQPVFREICDSDSVHIGGITYNESGLYPIASATCDTTILLSLSVLPNQDSYDTLYVCKSDSIFVEGDWITTGGDYNYNFLSDSGCDSIHHVFVGELESTSFSETVSICAGDSILRAGVWHTDGGAYEYTETGANGCDSIYILQVSHFDNYYIHKEFSICQGDSALVEGVWYNEDSLVMSSFMSMEGCDSIIASTVIVSDNYLVEHSRQICEGDSIELFGRWEKEQGIYLDSLKTTFGCDSIISIELSVTDDIREEEYHNLCQSDSIYRNEQWLSEEGVYTSNYPSSGGCDSISVINIVILEEYHAESNLDICQGDSVLIYGEWQTEAGVYRQALSTINGCDSTLSTQLNVLNTYTERLTFDLCDQDSIMVQGNWIYQEGTYVDSLQGIKGCDSIIVSQVERTIFPYPAIMHIDCEDQTITLAITEEDGIDYVWSNGSHESDIEVDFSSNPHIELESQTGCYTLIPIEVPPSYNLNTLSLPNDTVVFSEELITLSIPLSEEWTIEWYPDQAIDCKTCSLVTIDPTLSTFYSISLDHISGCSYEHAFSIEIENRISNIYIPNIILLTSELNDLWQVSTTDDLEVTEVSIFDRWGNKICCQSHQFSWDGTRNGNEAEQGVYIYRVEYIENGMKKIQTGDITVLR